MGQIILSLINPGFEPVTFQSPAHRDNHCATRALKSRPLLMLESISTTSSSFGRRHVLDIVLHKVRHPTNTGAWNINCPLIPVPQSRPQAVNWQQSPQPISAQSSACNAHSFWTSCYTRSTNTCVSNPGVPQRGIQTVNWQQSPQRWCSILVDIGAEFIHGRPTRVRHRVSQGPPPHEHCRLQYQLSCNPGLTRRKFPHSVSAQSSSMERPHVSGIVLHQIPPF
jgi:hypothetical protein